MDRNRGWKEVLLGGMLSENMEQVFNMQQINESMDRSGRWKEVLF
ncbi:hypothetical protein [Bacillus mobilis]|nr:hypothetical protein [Bacillus mobilis]